MLVPPFFLMVKMFLFEAKYVQGKNRDNLNLLLAEDTLCIKAHLFLNGTEEKERRWKAAI